MADLDGFHRQKRAGVKRGEGEDQMLNSPNMSRREASRESVLGVTTMNGRLMLVRKTRPNESLQHLEKRLMASTTFHVNNVVRMKQALLSVKEAMSPAVAKEVRLLSALRKGGFKIDKGSVCGFDAVVKAAGIDLSVAGRVVRIAWKGQEQRFTDDFYWTGLRFILEDLLDATGVSFPHLDQRELVSVKKIAGDVDPRRFLRDLLERDEYVGPKTRFYGGKGLTALRKFVVSEAVVWARNVDLKRRWVGPLEAFLVLEPEQLFEALSMARPAQQIPARRMASKAERNEVAKVVKLIGGFSAHAIELMVLQGITKRAIVSYYLCRCGAQGALVKRASRLLPFKE